MSNRAILSVLSAHGIDCRLTRGVVYAYEIATARDENGVIHDCSDWVAVPTARSALLAWLGY